MTDRKGLRDRLFDEVDKRYGRNVARFVDHRISAIEAEAHEQGMLRQLERQIHDEQQDGSHCDHGMSAHGADGCIHCDCKVLGFEARQQDGSALHQHQNYDCGGKGHGPDTNEVRWCHDCTPHAALTALPPSAPPARSGGLNVLWLAMAIDQHALYMAAEPIYDGGTCTTDCAGDITARYLQEQDR